jgi:predicted porin
MKKSLLALAVLGAFAGMASAQSTVTLFGIVDTGLRQVKNGSNDSLKTMSTDGLNSSRLGFRGTEDLGGGLRAGFWLEAGLAADVGTVGGGNGLFNNSQPSAAAGATPAALAGTPGAFFNRRATVSLLGGFGEVRLGRDYVSTFWNPTIFDPFGTNGVGAFTNVSINGLGTLAGQSYVRANNIVAYYLPSTLGGLYGQLQTSAGENGGVVGDANKQSSGRIGYAAGPINVAFAYGVTDTQPEEYTHWNIGASYNFGFMNLMGVYSVQEVEPREQKTYLIGAVIPLGQGEFKVAYSNANQSGPTAALNGADADQIAVGYVYNLSKRTALYGHYSRIKNDNTSAAFVIAGGTGSAAGASSKGIEFGLRHSF